MTIKDVGRQSGQVIKQSSIWTTKHVVNVWRWLTAPLVNGQKGLSLNRFLAVAFGSSAIHGRLFHDQPITGWDIAMGTLAGALAFGHEVYGLFLEKTTIPKP